MSRWRMNTVVDEQEVDISTYRENLVVLNAHNSFGVRNITYISNMNHFDYIISDGMY